ncbi:uncharacterized protein BXZ73DRAFT_75688 [Epithele typhae]|uniref:uncharacterized protein n=1 Tax=Epithele typhae TaxID=378194 RepID=UPI002007AB3C|nr:uncharacterized protein BXZ73DRAFT_75688 [Epithele typhae]KAH9940066.1 hypothetical protein BXZ73DRAFT_75688 [Epithele typhae]
MPGTPNENDPSKPPRGGRALGFRVQPRPRGTTPIVPPSDTQQLPTPHMVPFMGPDGRVQYAMPFPPPYAVPLPRAHASYAAAVATGPRMRAPSPPPFMQPGQVAPTTALLPPQHLPPAPAPLRTQVTQPAPGPADPHSFDVSDSSDYEMSDEEMRRLLTVGTNRNKRKASAAETEKPPTKKVAKASASGSKSGSSKGKGKAKAVPEDDNSDNTPAAKGSAGRQPGAKNWSRPETKHLLSLCGVHKTFGMNQWKQIEPKYNEWAQKNGYSTRSFRAIRGRWESLQHTHMRTGNAEKDSDVEEAHSLQQEMENSVSCTHLDDDPLFRSRPHPTIKQEDSDSDIEFISMTPAPKSNPTAGKKASKAPTIKVEANTEPGPSRSRLTTQGRREEQAALISSLARSVDPVARRELNEARIGSLERMGEMRRVHADLRDIRAENSQLRQQVLTMTQENADLRARLTFAQLMRDAGPPPRRSTRPPFPDDHNFDLYSLRDLPPDSSPPPTTAPLRTPTSRFDNWWGTSPLHDIPPVASSSRPSSSTPVRHLPAPVTLAAPAPAPVEPPAHAPTAPSAPAAQAPATPTAPAPTSAELSSVHTPTVPAEPPAPALTTPSAPSRHAPAHAPNAPSTSPTPAPAMPSAPPAHALDIPSTSAVLPEPPTSAPAPTTSPVHAPAMHAATAPPAAPLAGRTPHAPTVRVVPAHQPPVHSPPVHPPPAHATVAPVHAAHAPAPAVPAPPGTVGPRATTRSTYDEDMHWYGADARIPWGEHLRPMGAPPTSRPPLADITPAPGFAGVAPRARLGHEMISYRAYGGTSTGSSTLGITGVFAGVPSGSSLFCLKLPVETGDPIILPNFLKQHVTPLLR